MRGETMVVKTELYVENCCTCGAPFAMEAGFREEMRLTHAWLYCPAGHAQRYETKTDAEKQAEKAREERDAALRKLDQAQAAIASWREEAAREKASHAATKGQLTKVRNRIEKGVCPECHRHFTNVERHMATQHGDPETRKAAAAREKAATSG